jgi:hypothetical protein
MQTRQLQTSHAYNNKLSLLNITEHSHGPNFKKNHVMFGIQCVERPVEETSELPRDKILKMAFQIPSYLNCPRFNH